MWCWNSLALWHHKWNKCTKPLCLCKVQNPCAVQGHWKVLRTCRAQSWGCCREWVCAGLWRMAASWTAGITADIKQQLGICVKNGIALKIFKAKKKREIKQCWLLPGFFFQEWLVQWSLLIKWSFKNLLRNPDKFPPIISVSIWNADNSNPLL